MVVERFLLFTLRWCPAADDGYDDGGGDDDGAHGGAKSGAKTVLKRARGGFSINPTARRSASLNRVLRLQPLIPTAVCRFLIAAGSEAGAPSLLDVDICTRSSTVEHLSCARVGHDFVCRTPFM